MKKFLMALAVLAMVGSANAQVSSRSVLDAGFDKLTEVQKAEILKQVAQQAQESKSPMANVATVDKVEKWVQVGSNLGKGLAATAKELGVAVNEFATTPIGMLATALIVWHLIGGVLVHIFGGILMLIVGFMAIRFVVNRSYPFEYTYDETKRTIFGGFPVKTKRVKELSSDMVGFIALASAVVMGSSVWIMFSF